MGLESNISWCDHTINLWWGCQKVSPGCKFCYADVFSKRTGRGELWGPPAHSERMIVKSAFNTLAKIAKIAAATGETQRVFVQSMSDIFEDMQGNHPHIDAVRDKAFGLMPFYTGIDFLLLTKRPENVKRFVPKEWLTNWPDNVLLGISAENQPGLEKRLSHALSIPARRFLSCEPLLSGLDIGQAIANSLGIDIPSSSEIDLSGLLHWVIVGGESGMDKGVRPMNPAWVDGIYDWCKTTDTPFFFKQWGRYIGLGKNTSVDKTIRRTVVYGDVTYVDMGRDSHTDGYRGREWHEFYRKSDTIHTIGE